MGISGNWVNVYNSTMDLTQTDTGIIFGSYSSTTGSSGAYYIVGYGNTAPEPGNGQPFALSILWRSYEGGAGDPSWHYVSGFSGQSIDVNGVQSLVLLHDMVATAPFPGVVPGVGSYLDKLVYTPQNSSKTRAPKKEFAKTAGLASPIDGVWNCIQDPSITLNISLQDSEWGYVTGTMTWGGVSVYCIGFTDPYAQSAGLALQGLSLSAYFPQSAQAVALAGSLNLGTGALSLAQLTSEGTAPTSLWTQTTFAGLDFIAS